MTRHVMVIAKKETIESETRSSSVFPQTDTVCTCKTEVRALSRRKLTANFVSPWGLLQGKDIVHHPSYVQSLIHEYNMPPLRSVGV